MADLFITLKLARKCKEEKKIFLVSGKVIIGSTYGNGDIKLECPYVSRMHLSVKLEAEEIVFEDLQSHNGTFINSENLSKLQKINHSSRNNHRT